MRGLGITTLLAGEAVPIMYSFDPVNRTGGALSAGNTVVTATTVSDRYFLGQPSLVGEYVEFEWDGRGASNHSWGVAPFSASGPIWNSSWISVTGFVSTNTPHLVGMKRDAAALTVWLDNGAGVTVTLPSPAAVLYWAMSATAPATYRVRQPSEFAYQR